MHVGLFKYDAFDYIITCRCWQCLDQATSIMLDSRLTASGRPDQPSTSQLMLIISDGRGLYLEGMDKVKAAVRRAHAAKVFIVFVILDNPLNKVIVRNNILAIILLYYFYRSDWIGIWLYFRHEWYKNKLAIAMVIGEVRLFLKKQ